MNFSIICNLMFPRPKKYGCLTLYLTTAECYLHKTWENTGFPKGLENLKLYSGSEDDWWQ